MQRILVMSNATKLATLAVVEAFIATLVEFGVVLTPEQGVKLMGLAAAILGLVGVLTREWSAKRIPEIALDA
ncbi:MAG: hypothetical protein WC565_02885 [Parcubacteria group bacterium]